MNQAYELEKMMEESAAKTKGSTRFVAITSGKGGVGKSSISANLGYILASKFNKKTAVFDADIGLANLDLIFGIKTQKNILHALKGEVSFDEIAYEIEGAGQNLFLIPGDSGEEILKYGDAGILEQTLGNSSKLANLDFVIIDTGAGIGGTNQKFLDASDFVVVVTMPDPAAIADAYAVIKLNAKKNKEMGMVFNMVSSENEAQNLFKKISEIATKHIPGIKLDYLGHIPLHTTIKESTRNRELFAKAQSVAPPSLALKNIAAALLKKMEQNVLLDGESGGFKAFLERILSRI